MGHLDLLSLVQFESLVFLCSEKNACLSFSGEELRLFALLLKEH